MNKDKEVLADMAQRAIYAVDKVAKAITADAAQGQDAQGGAVASLTEAVMGITAAMTEIAHALHDIASAMRETRE